MWVLVTNLAVGSAPGPAIPFRAPDSAAAVSLARSGIARVLPELSSCLRRFGVPIAAVACDGFPGEINRQECSDAGQDPCAINANDRTG